MVLLRQVINNPIKIERNRKMSDIVIFNSFSGEWLEPLPDVPDDPQSLHDRFADLYRQQGYTVMDDWEHEQVQENVDEFLSKGKTTIGDLELKAEGVIRKPGRMPWRRMPGRMPWRRMPGSPKSLVRELLPKASVPHDVASGCLRRIVAQNVPKQMLGREIAKQIVRQNATRQMLGPEIAKQMALPGIGIPLAAVSFCANLLVAVAAEKLGKSSTPDEL